MGAPPSESSAAQVIKDPQKLIERVREATVQMGHEFISYDLETWIFRVPMF